MRCGTRRSVWGAPSAGRRTMELCCLQIRLRPPRVVLDSAHTSWYWTPPTRVIRVLRCVRPEIRAPPTAPDKRGKLPCGFRNI
ncbi:unnamed protein product [Staurois parvus]|uniref:Secreted protein n=1 Tax=Staurois parvus TaxID=386267 RepID=A0ABN9ACR4_9NEOB|nr:unnamed protein product [Staurois parvus]